jgi:murein L,D-transpeptidase YcbB/YkuD
MNIARRLSFVALALAVAACHSRRTDKYIPQETAEVLGVDAPSIQRTIVTLVDSGAPPAWVTPERWKRVRALYASYEYAPLWIEEGGVKERASALLTALQNAPTHALRTDAYPLDSIAKWVNDHRIDSTAGPSVIANADIVLTAAYVAYASDMLVGQIDPKQFHNLGTFPRGPPPLILRWPRRSPIRRCPPASRRWLRATQNTPCSSKSIAAIKTSLRRADGSRLTPV